VATSYITQLKQQKSRWY